MKEKSADDLWWASLCVYALLSEDTLVMRFARKQSKIDVNRYVIQRLPNLNMSEHASNFILFCLTVSQQQVFAAHHFLNHPWLQKERLPEERPIETSNYAEMAYLVRMGVILPNDLLWNFVDCLFQVEAFENTHFGSRD